MNMQSAKTGKHAGRLAPLLLFAFSFMVGAGCSDRLDVDPYPHCRSYPCYDEIVWWQELWQKEKQNRSSQANTVAAEQIWSRLRRLGYRAKVFNLHCRRQACSPLEIARHRQRVVYRMDYLVERGIPPPTARARPAAGPSFVSRWCEPLLLAALIVLGLLAACLRWGLLGAYAFIGLVRDIWLRIGELLGDLRYSLPRPALRPALWAGLFLVAGWFMLVYWQGWDGALGLVAGSGL